MIRMLRPFLKVKTIARWMYGVAAAPIEMGGERITDEIPTGPELHSPAWTEMVRRMVAGWWVLEGPEEAFEAADYTAHRAFMDAVKENYPRDVYDITRMNETTYHLDYASAVALMRVWVEAFFAAGGAARRAKEYQRPEFTRDVYEFMKKGGWWYVRR